MVYSSCSSCMKFYQDWDGFKASKMPTRHHSYCDWIVLTYITSIWIKLLDNCNLFLGCTAGVRHAQYPHSSQLSHRRALLESTSGYVIFDSIDCIVPDVSGLLNCNSYLQRCQSAGFSANVVLAGCCNNITFSSLDIAGHRCQCPPVYGTQITCTGTQSPACCCQSTG